MRGGLTGSKEEEKKLFGSDTETCGRLFFEPFGTFPFTWNFIWQVRLKTEVYWNEKYRKYELKSVRAHAFDWLKSLSRFYH